MNTHGCSLHELATRMNTADNSKTLKVSLTKEKLSQLSVAKTQSLHELPPDVSAMQTRPWRNSPKYFTQVYISTVALVKMSTHAKSGGSIEIMGMLTGKIVKDSFIVMDVYALPVEGTETRVNAQSEAYEYMVQYLDNLNEVRPKEIIVGWYHSHPGYGCWLSGIDVATQSLNQNFQDPYLAIVIDPSRTSNQGKVEIGAFRTFPVGYAEEKSFKKTPSRQKESASTSDDKMQDMGAHSDQYYSLDIRLFENPHDEQIVNAILDKSWVSSIVDNLEQNISYNHNLITRMKQLMCTKPFESSLRADMNKPGRYERLFEKIVSAKGANAPSKMQGTETKAEQMQIQTSRVDRLRKLINDNNQGTGVSEGLEEIASSYDSGSEEGEDGTDDALEELDNDSESRMELDQRDEDANSSRAEEHTREDYDDIKCDDESTNAHTQGETDPDDMEDEDFPEDYGAGHGLTSTISKKGLKRNLRTSSEESKSCLYLGIRQSMNRKRFAANDAGCALKNESKHMMHNVQLELRSHVKQTKSIGEAELLRLIGKRTSQKVFGKHDW